MPIQYRNQGTLHSTHPQIAQALDDIVYYMENIANQTNSNPHGSEVLAPPKISRLSVQAAQGIHDIAITDNTSPVMRGINYYVEYSPTPQFVAPTVIDLGASRNHRVALGNQNLYFRAYSAYPNSKRSEPVYFGEAHNPLPVTGGGATAGPPLHPSNGSGTSVGASPSDGGFGNNLFRGDTRPVTGVKTP